MRLTLATLAVVAAAAFAPPAAAASPEQTVAAFYRAFAAADLAAVRSLTDLAADRREALERRLAAMRVSCRVFHGAAFETLQGGEGTMRLRAQIALTKMPRSAGAKPQNEDHSARLTLARRGEGWIITEWAIEEERRDARSDVRTPLLSRALSEEAIRLVNDGGHAAAGVIADRATAVARETGDDAALALALSVESVLARIGPTPDLTRSADLGEQALALAEAAGDPDVHAKALLRAARALNAARGVVTMPMLERVVAMAGELEDPATVTVAATQLAMQAEATGDGLAALRYAEITSEYGARTGNPIMMMQGDLHLAGLYSSMDFTLAVEHATNALRAARAAGYNLGIASSLLILARCHRHAGDAERFLPAADEAIERFARAGASASVRELRTARALFFIDRGRLDDARRDIDAGAHELASAELALADGDPARALAILDARGLDAEALRNEPWHRVAAARALRALGRRDEAYQHLFGWLATIEEKRGVVPGGDRQRRLALETAISDGSLLIEMLVADGRHAEALRIAERFKARTLLDRFARGTDLDERALGDAERADLRRLEERASRPGIGGATDPSIRRTRLELESLRAQLAAKYPRAAEPAAEFDEASLRAIAAETRTAFVEYLVTRDALYLFTVTRRGVAAKCVEIRAERLQELTAGYARRLAERDFRHREPGERLFALLLGPVWNSLRDARTICIVPNGPVWDVPFQALIAPGGGFLIEHAAVLYAPSLAALDRLRARPQGATSSVLAIGDARSLPHAAREARTVARLHGGSALFLDGGAAARPRLDGHRVLHVATHGRVDADDPMFSHLLLRDGPLRAWEVARMKLDAELAVLSACETARGRFSSGEGMLGLAWAFLAAGTRAAVVSQWNVDSEATEGLMIDFHRGLLRGASTARALQLAQQQVLRNSADTHPYYWASFIVIGYGLSSPLPSPPQRVARPQATVDSRAPRPPAPSPRNRAVLPAHTPVPR